MISKSDSFHPSAFECQGGHLLGSWWTRTDVNFTIV
jgi:hypothetical protein